MEKTRYTQAVEGPFESFYGDFRDNESHAIRGQSRSRVALEAIERSGISLTNKLAAAILVFMFVTLWGFEAPSSLGLELPILQEAISAPEDIGGRVISEGKDFADMSASTYTGAPSSCRTSSIFGIHGPSIIERPINPGNKPPGIDTLKDIHESGAGWVRLDRVFIWDAIERTKGQYRWQRADYIINEANINNLCAIVVVMAFNKNDGTKKHIPQNMAWFLEFLQKAVERYKNAVLYWQIENEIDKPIYWRDNPANYAKLLKEAYRVIKQANPDAKVVLGAMSSPKGIAYHSQVIEQLGGGKYFDIFDLHWFSDSSSNGYRTHAQDKAELDSTLALIRKTLAQSGYEQVPVWIGETGDYSGRPNNPSRSFEEHSEEAQATALVKMYLYSLSHGVKKLFWVSLTEWHGFAGATGGYFDRLGLIYNPLNDGRSDKKLSYYAYRKMTELFEKTDMEKTEIFQESADMHIYKFIVNGKPLWVAWNDDGQSRDVVIPASASVSVIRAIPVRNENNDIEFKAETVVSKQDGLHITLNRTPVFIPSE